MFKTEFSKAFDMKQANFMEKMVEWYNDEIDYVMAQETKNTKRLKKLTKERNELLDRLLVKSS